ncbi:MAG: hypothetical protein WBA57_24535 [Elainellaceae cyanobacterium]
MLFSICKPTALAPTAIAQQDSVQGDSDIYTLGLNGRGRSDGTVMPKIVAIQAKSSSNSQFGELAI